ncbi:MAG: PQQ-binding-like beta-propeller repeat protein [Planctomycetaceae bacterium]
MSKIVTLGLLFFCLACGSLHAGDWPGFRGPDGNGIAPGESVPSEWGPEKNIRWKKPLPGPGNSSPIVSGGHVYLATAEDKGKKRHLICFDRATGDRVWVKTVEYDQAELSHETNPPCASTPVTDGERIVVWHGSPGIFCYDTQGKLLWERKLGNVEHIWGFGSSPILHRGAVIINYGPGVKSFVAALDLESGEVLWTVDEPGGVGPDDKKLAGSWSTPIVATVAGKEQIICSMPTRVVAYDPQNKGAILWSCGGMSSERGDLSYASPVISGDLLVALGGYQGPAIGLKLGGSGDITETNRIWREAEKQPQRIGSGVVVDGKLFIANAGPGTAQCIDCATGKTLWTERLNAGDHWGSCVLVDGKIYVTGQKGVTTVFRPNPEKFELVAENDLGESSNATPAISAGEIFLRTDNNIYCVSEKK